MEIQSRAFQHVPIMKAEVLDYLSCGENKNYIDFTLGGAGHALEILKCSAPKGRLLGVDRDPNAIAASKKHLKDFRDRVVFLNKTMVSSQNDILEFGLESIDGALMDCGVSSHQLDSAERGFSYMHAGPIDMRMGSSEITAKNLIEDSTEEELADIIYLYSDERLSRRISKRLKSGIAAATTTLELKALIDSAIPKSVSFKRRKDSVSRTFQALRIAVNQELDQIRQTLLWLIRNLKSGARIVVITFHSIEDRLVKQVFRAAEQKKELRRLNKKVCVPSAQEQSENKRSRSSKLRAVELIEAEERMS